MASKHGLGKGIAALLPDEEDTENAEFALRPHIQNNESRDAVMLIPLGKIATNPEQPRKIFDEGELAELADSIREHGIIQPLIVEETGNDLYTIVAGERRIRAAKMAGLKEAPVIIRKYSDEKRMVISLIENIQRTDLNPLEEAHAYKRLMELTGLSQDECAIRVGKNRSTVANALRLLKLPFGIQESVKEGDISPGHARAILSLSDENKQDNLFREILKKSLSVREAEKLAAVLNGGKKAKKTNSPKPGRAPEIDAMEEKFMGRLGTKVKINGDLNQGTIVIDYYSMEDLERLYDIFNEQGIKYII
jgi:ParB family chromosome partitioning protein